MEAEHDPLPLWSSFVQWSRCLFYFSIRVFTTERMGGFWPTMSEVEAG